MAARLKLYTVHMQPDAPQPYETLRVVPYGFNWMAAIFHGLWMWYHRMWFTGLVCLLLLVGVHQLEVRGVLQVASVGLIQLAIRVLIGLEAGDLHRFSLRRRGFVQVDVVSAGSLEEAQQRFFERQMVPVPAPAQGAVTLGWV